MIQTRAQRASTLVLLLLLALSTVAPSALATWGARGAYEPDTPHDVADDWMFEAPPASATGHLVYFNGFEGVCSYPECTTVSPNLATARTAFHGNGYENFVMLGVWRDCNGDGYVGFSDQGLWEYRVDLLVGPFNTGFCPVQTFRPTNPTQEIYHNDGAWVHEFVPIQWKHWFADRNPFNIDDNESRVWVDGGAPDDDLGTSASSSCHLGPQPRGTFHNAGGLLYWSDCFTAYRATDAWNGLAHDGRTPGVSALGQTLAPPIDTGVKADDAGAGQLSFYDSPRYQGRSQSVLNAKPWGEESDASMAHAWDCSQPQAFSPGPTIVKPPVGNWVWINVTNVSAPSGDLHPDSAGSPAGTVNETLNGLDQCGRRPDARGGTGGAYARYPYEPATCFVHIPCEADEVSGVTPGKVTTQMLVPIESVRPGGAGSLVDKRTPPDSGVHVAPNTDRYTFGDQDLWEPYVVALSNAGTFYRTTFYAYVSPSAVARYTLTLPHGNVVGSYGAEACGTRTSGVSRGWQCDATLWWRGPNGEDVRPRDPLRQLSDTSQPGSVPVDISVHVGSPFNLRDVDCVDLSVGATRDAELAPQQVADLAGQTLAPVVADLAPGLSPTLASVAGGTHHC